MSSKRTSRRAFLRAGAGAAAGVGASATAAAQADGDRPDFGGWLSDADGGFEDARGQAEVTVRVGAQGNGGQFAFDPAGLWVDPGTTVRWEWTGGGGRHNVHAVEGAGFDSGDPVQESGVNFEHTFEEGGIVKYQCDPHVSLGMKGAVAVGDDVPTGGGSGDQSGGSADGGDGGGGPLTISPKASQPVVVVGSVAIAFMALVVAITLHMTYVSMGESPPAADDVE